MPVAVFVDTVRLGALVQIRRLSTEGRLHHIDEVLNFLEPFEQLLQVDLFLVGEHHFVFVACSNF